MAYLKKKYFAIASVTFLLIISAYFIFRNALLHFAISEFQQKLEARSGIRFKAGHSSFTALTTVTLTEVSAVPANGDTLLVADTIRLRPAVLPLFSGTLRIRQVFASGIQARIENGIRNNNIHFIGKAPASASVKESHSDYAQFIAENLDRAFNFAPQRADIVNSSLRYSNDTLARTMQVNEFHSDENSVKGEMLDVDRGNKWMCNGTFSQSKHHLDVYVFPETGGRRPLPLVKELAGAFLSFDSLHLMLDGYVYSGGQLHANGFVSVSSLSIDHKRISEDTVKVRRAAMSYSFTATENAVMLDSSSAASLTGIHFNPYLRYEKSKSKKYSLRIRTDTVPSTTFFKSLPEGVFDEVRTIEAQGTLQFGLNFFLDSSQPDSLQFDCTLKKNRFRITRYGELMKMRGEFVHSVYENDRFMRTVVVGPSNPEYIPLEDISPYFKNSVLTSEDGNFFFHNGFNEDAFRKSIATNYKAKKFLRGGSTISMQLVKNIYLDRKKTIARKAEEALIVWLIERNRLYTKERMFEVYLNIIELGPGIYGIGEASRFYFDKKPSKIKLNEGIFLASLLPHPKWFRYSFDASGELKPYLAGYYRIMSNFLLKKELITQEEHDKLEPTVKIKGPAMKYILPDEKAPEDDGREF